MLRFSYSALRAVRPTVPLESLHRLLHRSGAFGTDAAVGKTLQESNPSVQLFTPLFTPDFAFENHQLTTLGDTIIDDYLSDVVSDYAIHTGLVLTTNNARQLNAVLHNHYTLRLFAHELGFDELAVPYNTLTGRSDDGNGDGSNDDPLSFLEPQRLGPQRRDVTGTSFHVVPLRAGQSCLGWKLSHYVGAVQCALGPEAAWRVVAEMYGRLEHVSNLPHHAVALLHRVVTRFPTANVAEAILAAQGLPTRFAARTRVLEWDEATTTAPGDARPDATATTHAESHPAADGVVGVHTSESPATPQHSDIPTVVVVGSAAAAPNSVLDLDKLSTERNLLHTLAAGPGGLDTVEQWKQRTAALVNRGLEPALVAENSTAEVSPVDDGVDSAGLINSGWLAKDEVQRFSRGPAFANSIDFSAHAISFADTYGDVQPVDGVKITRQKFGKQVRDPAFYDRQSDMRNGIPFDTEGVPLADYLARFTMPHKRLFEVSLYVGIGDGRLAGRAISTRYTVARRAVCAAYLDAIVRDLEAMTTSSPTGES